MLVLKLNAGGRFGTDKSDVVVSLPDGRRGTFRIIDVCGQVVVGVEFPKDVAVNRLAVQRDIDAAAGRVPHRAEVKS